LLGILLYMIKIKRVYEEYSEEDGYRILVDRLWPRGLSKSKAKVDLWLKDVAPSSELRKWFAHDPERWEEFQNKYRNELANKKEFLEKIKDLEMDKTIISLLYSAKDKKHNNAVVLIESLK
jgi:uncharacterized protein YeaO (DUF488 family)